MNLPAVLCGGQSFPTLVNIVTACEPIFNWLSENDSEIYDEIYWIKLCILSHSACPAVFSAAHLIRDYGTILNSIDTTFNSKAKTLPITLRQGLTYWLLYSIVLTSFQLFVSADLEVLFKKNQDLLHVLRLLSAELLFLKSV